MTETRETTFSPVPSIDIAIKEMLPNFNAESQKRMRKRILNAKKSAIKHGDENTDAAARHIFREFIPSSILNQNGFSFEYERPLLGKKPDWMDERARLMMESYTYERGGTSHFLDRIMSKVTCKCNKYKSIIEEKSLSFIIAVYIDSLSDFLLVECRENPKMFRPVFDLNNSLWALLFFTETFFIEKKTTLWFLLSLRGFIFRGDSELAFRHDKMHLNRG